MIQAQLLAAKAAKDAVAALTTEEKNRALSRMADALVEEKAAILKANENDLENAKDRISSVMLDRLRLTGSRIEAMAQGLRDVASLPDPVGRVLEETSRTDGLTIRKVSVPLGVVAIIYESRPNVTSDAAALCLKSGNACLLRVGKEAFASARAITDAMRRALSSCGVTSDAVQLTLDPSRASAEALMTANGMVDLLIPRGGAGLIRACVEKATVPCIETGTGVCHVYVERSADLSMALDVIENAKTSRPSVCNAEEVLLLDRAIAQDFLPRLYDRLVTSRVKNGLVPVEMRLDGFSQKIIPGTPAGEQDFDTEFLDYILAVKCVENTQEAIDHIARHSTHHSEAILTKDDAAATLFTKKVDSAAVYVNASTRFTDGGEFGLGCEMGISTQKLHARGPMGLRELNTYKYIVYGNGHVR